MDTMNKTFEMDTRSPLKELNTKNNKPAEPCDNQNKNAHLFDMESSFLQNSVMIPAEFNSIQNGELDGTNNSNQENQIPRYSILNTFDPIIKRETDDLSCNDDVLNKSADFPIAEDSVEISAAVNETCDTLGSSVSNISSQSDNSVLNNTVVLNKSLTVENVTPPPEQKLAAVNRSLNVSCTEKQSEQNLDTADQSFGNSKNLSVILKPTDISLPDVSDSDLKTPEQSFNNGSSISLSENESSTLKPEPDVSVGESVTVVSSELSYYTTDNSIVVDDISLNVSLTSTPNPDDENAVIREQNIKTVIDHLKLKDNIGSGCISPTPSVNAADDSLIHAFATKLVFSPAIKESDKTPIKDIHTDEVITNEVIETAVNESKVELDNKCEINDSELPTDITEIPHEISIESIKIVNDLNEINVALDEQVPVELNEVPETITNKDISTEINTSEFNEEDIKECGLENKNVSSEIIESNEINKDEAQSLEESVTVTDTIPLSTLVVEVELEVETHMSASEPNSGLNEPTVADRLALETSAACTNTNEMGEIINQNECFEKQSDITNGAIDNKETLEAKARVYKEMAEKYAIVEGECEKFKEQVADLKKELKSCRQKTVALETEVADLKRRENELNVLLEEYKSAASKGKGKGDADDQDEQLHRLQASEEALKNEVKELNALVNQHESRLKELQRKEVKLADDLTSKTQSEMQISRVMEEYEKSISSLISDNEKMKKERDTAQMHLANIEMAFSDVHQKYERCKSIVQVYKDNEESYKQDIAMNRETIVIQEQKYESLKAHAMNQLEKSNQELATMKKQHETEMARLAAQLKRYEIKNQSLMESLQQKAKECEQLSAVCDEFIGNV